MQINIDKSNQSVPKLMDGDYSKSKEFVNAQSKQSHHEKSKVGVFNDKKSKQKSKRGTRYSKTKASTSKQQNISRQLPVTSNNFSSEPAEKDNVHLYVKEYKTIEIKNRNNIYPDFTFPDTKVYSNNTTVENFKKENIQVQSQEIQQNINVNNNNDNSRQARNNIRLHFESVNNHYATQELNNSNVFNPSDQQSSFPINFRHMHYSYEQLIHMSRHDSGIPAEAVRYAATGAASQYGWTIFVSNLVPDVTSSNLRNLFSFYGVVYCTQVKNTRGYGFVVMSFFDEALSAVSNLQRYKFFGRIINVSFKTFKSKRKSISHQHSRRSHNRQAEQFFINTDLNEASYFEGEPRYDNIYQMLGTNDYRTSYDNNVSALENNLMNSSIQQQPAPNLNYNQHLNNLNMYVQQESQTMPQAELVNQINTQMMPDTNHMQNSLDHADMNVVNPTERGQLPSNILQIDQQLAAINNNRQDRAISHNPINQRLITDRNYHRNIFFVDAHDEMTPQILQEYIDANNYIERGIMNGNEVYFIDIHSNINPGVNEARIGVNEQSAGVNEVSSRVNEARIGFNICPKWGNK